ncbi:uncharacterized protein LOC129572056 isoform X2 [Sitodiplosis mosellana]|uniref:uncharacterized protein LOC129572056 isoform X2 n=1 Tax=Sitodiplosis mosellana TaxID=263140 RepID=UPI0024440FBE|nr:uncharacterized protein LOC129572056 isoform X2 [Sitodiplosis mosellana]
MSENTESIEGMSNKRQKLDENNDVGPSGSPIPIDQNEESPRLFKLNIDCFNELLDYLSTKDLLVLSQTCKTMQQVVGVYAKENHSQAAKMDQNIAHKQFSNNGIECAETLGFNQFIRYIDHYSDNTEPLHYIGSHNLELISVDHLYVDTIDLNSNVDRLQNMLHRLKVFQIRRCIWEGDFYERILRYCVNLKRLNISDSEGLIKRSGNDWLLKSYPSLEHLGLLKWPIAFDVNELIGFFELNPNVRSFMTSYELLSKNRIEFIESGIHLDVLEVKLMEKSRLRMNARVNEFFGLLSELYDRVFFNRLHLYVQYITKNSIAQIASLQGLEKLCFDCIWDGYDWPYLPLLKDLDDLFVASKWIATHGNMNLNLVEIRRSDSYRWDHYYDFCL